MKGRTIIPLVLVFSISALAVYFLTRPQPVTFLINSYVTLRVDENGGADAEWVYEVPPSKLADHMRLFIAGGTIGGIPVRGIGVENAKLMFSATVVSSYAKYGMGMENVSCDIAGLGEGETFKVTMRWRTPYLAYRKDNGWEILFQPVDNEGYARGTINELKSVQSTLSVIERGSQLNFVSRSSIVMPAGSEIYNENQLLGLGTKSVDYGGGSTGTFTVYLREIDGKPVVVWESRSLIKQQLITISEEEFLKASQFVPIIYTAAPPVYGFDGYASWAATDMKFGRERDEYTISFDGVEFNITPYQLLYYSAKRVVILAENRAEPLLSGVKPISVLPPDSESGDWNAIFRTLTKGDYVAIARDIRNQIDSTGKVVGTINSPIGRVRSRDALFTFLRAIEFYHEHGRLPDNITFVPAPTDNLVRDDIEIPASHAYFLLSTQYSITGTPRLSQKVSALRGLGYGDRAVAENLNEWVHRNIRYELVLGWFTSEEVLNMGAGQCLGMANLYLALMRTAGVPARRVTGYLIHERLTYPFLEIAGVTPDGRFIVGHAWTEVYLPPEGWVFADPTWNVFRAPTHENYTYSRVEETWQEVLASHEITYGKII